MRTFLLFFCLMLSFSAACWATDPVATSSNTPQVISRSPLSDAFDSAPQQPSQNQPETLRPAQAWRVQTVLRDIAAADNNPSRCRLEQLFTKDIRLQIDLDQTRTVRLRVLLPQGPFKAGDSYSITLQVDNKLRRVTVGTALSSTLVTGDFGDDDQLLVTLARGKTLTLVVDTSYLALPLHDYTKAINVLKSCVPRLGTTIITADGGTLWPEAVRSLLDHAGLGYAQPVAMNATEQENRQLDYGWTINSLFGGMRERSVMAGADLRDLTRAYDDGFAYRCQQAEGAYSSSYDRMMATDSTLSVSGTLLCLTPDQKTTAAAVLFYLTSTNRLTFVLFEGERRDLPEAMAARDAIRRALATVFR